ncbi:diacylglycerol lipase-beta-like isoform X1 [Panicum virgatum]|nr:diacylglycerol lipase-beta-like isoform X1 [Panicum virgatum]
MPRKTLLPTRGPTTPSPPLLLLRRLLPRRRAPSSPPARRRTAAMAPRAGDPAAAAAASFRVGMVRVVSFLVGGLNLAVLLLGLYLADAVLPSGCHGLLAFAAAPALAGVRVLAMIGAARAQHATADAIARRHLHEDDASVAADAVARHEIRVRYKRWLWWTRFGMAVGVLQLVAAIYLMFVIVRDLSKERRSTSCFFGQDEADRNSGRTLIALFLILSWVVVIIQCFTGSDILRWRSFYATHDMAWKAHYREVFDHGIREALCCLGRAKYLTVLEEDEVYSVARLLGDLVAYRASGTGHLELLAGLALLQKHGNLPESQTDLMEASHELMQEAAFLHPFAEACYTGPLLDFGRNPILFPCAWVYRQGVLTPWARRRRPALDGDNWWRGHAAAFLRFVNIPPKALLRGRVCQSKREAAYFVVVLHDKRTVVIGVRGTETPEDLITDGLCRECAFTMEDLDGLINSEKTPAATRERVISTFPHYGHGGIVEAARELFMQLNECTGENTSSGRLGFLSTLLGQGSECHGYKVRIVGHSLGGAVATVLGMMLFGKYPDVHVYAYGPLPCVDFIIAEACSHFVTSIICNYEFSSRLSINSILRLRSAAISALSDNSPADTAMIQKLARRILHVNRYHDNGTHGPNDDIIEGYSDRRTAGTAVPNETQISHQDLLCNTEPELQIMQNGFVGYSGSSGGLNNDHDVQIIPIDGSDSGFKEHPASYRGIPVEPPEMFLPGLIVHMVRQRRSLLPLWQCWNVQETEPPYKAVFAKRENFRDIVVTPSMFTDHLPWRCHLAMQKILEAQTPKRSANSGSHIQHLV